MLTSSSLKVSFISESNRLSLGQIQHGDQAPMLYSDTACQQPGPGAFGNPLALVIREGKFACTNAMEAFQIVKLDSSDQKLTAYLRHDRIPLEVALQVSLEGSAIKWLGQALWNGDEPIEAEVFFPMLSRVRFASPQQDRAVTPQISGSVRGPLGEVNYVENYVGRFASPCFLVEGGGRGLAILDDNRADYAPDPGATCLRSYVVANEFPPRRGAKAGPSGPIVGVGHKRVFKPISVFGGERTYNQAEAPGGPMPLRKLGDAVDLGPVFTFAYTGDWKAGAAWLRQQRAWVPFRVHPGKWYQRTTFVGEEGGGALRGQGNSFFGLPGILEEKRKLGVDVFFITGFSEAEVVGTSGQSRGDYFFPADQFGGAETIRPGVEALHRAGGRLMYYIEGMIVWKRSRIGRSAGEAWALMEPDGQFTEHYKGFWHACPAYKPYQDWL
ncbi:MAG TPA: hypothetical protein VEC99_07640, partial [Clostridia bacterium]|nr:hypothetical protein [Clostridia bacterium]